MDTVGTGRSLSERLLMVNKTRSEKMKVYRVILVVVAAVFSADFAGATLVASDGFRTTGAVGDYTDGTLGTRGDVAPVGTAGFGTDNVDATSWANTTGDINVYS